MIDMYAGEPQFIDHLAPIWSTLSPSERGTFYVHPAVAARALEVGIKGQVHAVASPRTLVPTKAITTPILTASYGDIKKVRRLGYTRLAFIEHGIGQSYAGVPGQAATHGSYSGGKDRQDVSLFLVPGPNPAARWRATYPRARVELIGSPHVEHLPAREPGPGPVIAFSFHWPCHLAPETNGAWGSFMATPGETSRRYTVIGHGHPRVMSSLQRYYARAGIEPVSDFAEVCRRADLYICDNSSSMYEFAATGRPVVVLNSPLYRRNINHGLRFWEAADVGIQVDRPTDLAAAIEIALADPPEVAERREAALDLVYAHRSGAVQRAVDALLDWVDQSTRRAA